MPCKGIYHEDEVQELRQKIRNKRRDNFTCP